MPFISYKQPQTLQTTGHNLEYTRCLIMFISVIKSVSRNNYTNYKSVHCKYILYRIYTS